MKPGDDLIPKIIKNKKPVLHLTTHDLLNYSEIVVKALKPRLTYVELTRHPIDMVNQQIYIMKDHFNNPRSIQIEFEYKKNHCHIGHINGKKIFKLNNVDKAILNIYYMYKDNVIKRSKLIKLLGKNFLSVQFENFTSNPLPVLNKISKSLKSKITKSTLREMKNQKIPRDHFFKTPQTEIYQKVGGSLPNVKNRELDILRKIKSFKKKGASKKYLDLLENISLKYEKKFISKIL